LSDEDDKATTSVLLPTPSNPKENLRVKKGVLLSDDEELPQKDSRRLRLSSRAQSLVNSEAEREAHALMDIDDGMCFFSQEKLSEFNLYRGCGASNQK